MDTSTSRWSIRSEGSFLSIGSRQSFLSIGSVGSVLSIGSVGSTLSVASVGSVASVLSVGSAASLGSAMSALSRWSLLSFRSARGVLATGVDPLPRQRRRRPALRLASPTTGAALQLLRAAADLSGGAATGRRSRRPTGSPRCSRR